MKHQALGLADPGNDQNLGGPSETDQNVRSPREAGAVSKRSLSRRERGERRECGDFIGPPRAFCFLGARESQPDPHLHPRRENVTFRSRSDARHASTHALLLPAYLRRITDDRILSQPASPTASTSRKLFWVLTVNPPPSPLSAFVHDRLPPFPPPVPGPPSSSPPDRLVRPCRGGGLRQKSRGPRGRTWRCWRTCSSHDGQGRAQGHAGCP